MKRPSRQAIRSEIIRLKATGLTYDEIIPELAKMGVNTTTRKGVHYYVAGLDGRCPACLRKFNNKTKS